MSRLTRRHRAWPISLVALPALLGSLLTVAPSAQADPTTIVTSMVRTPAGAVFTATNHLVNLPE